MAVRHVRADLRKDLIMTDIIGMLIGLLLIGYLLMSILRPEKF